MTTLTYVEITQTWDDGSGSPATGLVTFTPSATVYAAGVAVIPDLPVQALVDSGELQAADGGPVRLLATDNEVTVEGPDPGWRWTVQVELTAGAAVATDTWSFDLPSSPATVDLYSTRNPA